MPLPNVSTLSQRLHPGSEGGHEFSRFIRLLLIREYENKSDNFISESDASGDYKKVDGYTEKPGEFSEMITGLQFKFYPYKLSPNQKSEIKKSLESALNTNKYMIKFILITPEDFMKEQQSWLEQLKEKHKHSLTVEKNGLFRTYNLELEHWGHTKIIELSLKHADIGIQYFPELFPLGVGKFKL